jgi:RNA polymerase sigma-70 factor, ECF subfamily
LDVIDLFPPCPFVTQIPDREPSRSEVTMLLAALSEGRDEALDDLFPLVYDDLRRIARNHLRSERHGHTLDTVALVHETYLSLAHGDAVPVRERARFFALASRAMRNILIDHARARKAVKRGGDQVRVTLTPRVASESSEARADIVDLHRALERLGERDPRMEQVVECKVFGGMTTKETAEALDIGVRTVEKDWTLARAFLHKELTGGRPTE